ncbi:MAG: hypothetical protein HY519_00275 [Candidatus Aenigmarchaeota archaeon]|nr:hypothetical protein [Candidatus Aenigmarchaeota archaeon]
MVYLAALAVTSVFALRPEWSIGALLVFAAPAGAITPTLAIMFKARIERNILNVVSTSLLVPLTMPLLFYYIIGSRLPVEYGSMFSFLAIFILVPYLASITCKRYLNRRVAEIEPHIPTGAIVILLFTMFGVGSGVSAEMLADMPLVLEILLIYLVAFAVTFSSGWLLALKKDLPDRMSALILTTWKNNSLAIVLAYQFFRETEPLIVFFAALSTIPWNLAFVPARWMATKLNGTASG